MECWRNGFGGMRSDFKGLAEIEKIIRGEPLLIRYIQYSIYALTKADFK
jgi:hypothetical protein